MSSSGTTEPACRLYVGNLLPGLEDKDLKQLFNITDNKQCSVEIVMDAGGKKNKGFAFCTVPESKKQDILNLNNFEFFGRQLVIEAAKSDDEKAAQKEKKENKRYDNKGKQGYNNRSNNRGQNQNRNWRGKGKFEIPNLAADQKIDLIDCGANLTSPKFMSNKDYVLARAVAGGIKSMIVTGLRLNGVKNARTMAVTRPNLLYVAAGIHPHFLNDDWKEEGKKKTVDELEPLIQDCQCVAIGECGLDYNKDYAPKDLQKRVFETHVKLAVKHQKPLLVHDRDAHDDIIEILSKKYDGPLPKVVIHCFTGTKDNIKAYLEKGFYIGITGYICKEKYGSEIRDAIKTGVLPLDRIALQSNAPFMLPSVPDKDIDPVSAMLLEYCFQGQNEPCALSVTVRTIAKQLEKEPRDVAKVLNQTAQDIFKFPPKC